jgi:ParB family transcriptional regulator, chromosome partitioning protein
METLQNTSTQSQEYRELPMNQLVESSTNPRKRYQQKSLEDLAQSFRSRGVLEPLLVRPIDAEQFEIVAGSRRYRAARLAELETVPARVREMTDAEALEVQCIENLQREDIHPLEEAQGFRALLNLPEQQYTVALIAERAGKNAAYVAARLKLTELIPEAADAFLGDRLTIGHALLIAKLPPAQQQEAFGAAFKSTWIGSAQTEILLPARELAAWIDSNLLLDLKTAPFDRANGSLVPEAGSCHDCAKRTGANSLLFPEAHHDACLDRTCWKGKIAAHLAASVERNPQLIQISSNWGSHANGILGRGQYVEIVKKASRNGHDKLPPERKKCPHIAHAIVVEGGNVGRIVDVCAHPGCDVHHAESRKSKEAQERRRNEHRKQEEQRKQELTTRVRVLSAILDKVAAPLTKADLELVAREFANRLPQEYRTILSQRYSPTPINTKVKSHAEEAGTSLRNLDEAGYSRLLIELSLLEATYNSYSRDGAGRLETVAKRYRVNIPNIAEFVAADFAARRKKSDERKEARAKGKNSSPKIASKRQQ